MRITDYEIDMQRLGEILDAHLPRCMSLDARTRLTIVLRSFITDEVGEAEESAFHDAVAEESTAVEDAERALTVSLSEAINKCLCDPCKREVALELEIRRLQS